MSDNSFDVFYDKEKAMRQALWLSFKNRITKTEFGVVRYKNNTWAVIESEVADSVGFPFEKMSRDYSDISYDIIRDIKMDEEPLQHLEELLGVFSVMDGELLRYILHAKIPLEKLIRYELAIRGFDKNHVWCGFEKAEDVWLK